MKHNYSKQRMRLRWITCIVLFVFCFHASWASGSGCTPPGASIATPGTLTCSSRTITLNASSPTAGVSYVWAGPSGFSSFSQTPAVSIAGTYYLTVTSPTGGCTSTASVSVLQDTVQPDAHTQVAGMITCASPSINVSGVSSTSGATFSWIGPGDYTAATKDISVSVKGGYTLMVTNPSNGCISTATAFADKNVELPLVSGYSSGILTCVVNSIQLTSSSPTTGVNFSWTGPGFNSASQNTVTSVPGSYAVTTTNPANGCSSSASVDVLQDISKPGAVITASTNTITCSAINADLGGSSPSVGVTYLWTGPSLNIEVQNVTVATAGKYILTVNKAQNGCISRDSTTIAVDKTRPDASATVNSPITCTTSSVTLQGSSQTAGATFKWTGPAAFGTSYVQNPTTTVSGGYVLSVTNPANGCMTTKPVVVSQNVSLPLSVSASSNGTLTCAVTSVTLTGSSTTSGVTYSWTAPNATILTGANPSVTAYGTYTLKVTNPANGCSVTTTTAVAHDIAPPSSVSATNSGSLTCVVNSVTISGNSSTPGVTYKWSGPSGFTSANQSEIVTVSGLYNLTVTNPANGCSASTLSMVNQNITKPGLVTAGNDGPLTCSFLNATLNASSSTTGVSYNWSGPGFTSTTKNPVVTSPGTYKVTITNTVNGCSDTTSTFVARNITVPGASVSPASTLTCSNATTFLSASSPTSEVIYNWSGPSAFSSSEKNPQTNKPGTYTVTVTDPVNNCISTASVTVSQDITVPAGVTASAPDLLTCARVSVSVSASSGTTGVSYNWSGPNGFTSAVQNPVVTSKGTYNVTVTSQANGCKSFANAIVGKDTLQPANVSAVASGILNCANATVTLTGSSTTDGVTYNWSGPGLTSTLATPVASASGTYNLTVTNPQNGCTKTTSVTVAENHTSPASVTVSTSGKLTCSTPHVTVSATSGTSGVEYNWSGPGNFVSNEQTPTIGIPGDYMVTVTHPVSRCFVTKTITVQQDTVSPVNVNAVSSGVLTCLTTSVNLTASSGTSGVSYSWNGPAGFTYNQSTPVVSKAGLYTVTVTNPSNGCYKVRTVTADIDTVHPADVDIVTPDKLNCNSQMVTLTGSSSTPGVEYEWDFYGSLYDISSVTFAVIEGDYSLIVSNPSNGCYTQKSVTVSSDYTPPVCNLSVADHSTVLKQSTNTITSVFSPSYSYNWTLTNWTALSGQTTNSLTYLSGNTGTTSRVTLNLLDNNNGCANTCSVDLSAVATKSALAEDESSVVKDLSMTVYPTPAIGKVYIEFASPEQTDATVTVYDANGSVVASLFNNQAEANQSYKVTFNENESLPAGIYFCILKTKTKTLSSKIVLR